MLRLTDHQTSGGQLKLKWITSGSGQLDETTFFSRFKNKRVFYLQLDENNHIEIWEFSENWSGRKQTHQGRVGESSSRKIVCSAFFEMMEKLGSKIKNSKITTSCVMIANFKSYHHILPVLAVLETWVGCVCTFWNVSQKAVNSYCVSSLPFF